MNDSFELNETIHNAVLKHSSSIIRIAFAYVKNIADAENIAQDTFLAYMISKPIFDNETHEKAWFIRVAINKSKNHLKASWLRRTKPLTDDLSYLPDDENEVLGQVLALDKKYRIPIHLYYYEGYSIKDIAHILQAKPATIGTRLARAREILHQKLGGYELG